MPDDRKRTKRNAKVTALRFGTLLKKLITYPSKEASVYVFIVLQNDVFGQILKPIAISNLAIKQSC
jgi:hypothetical protein